MVIQIPHNYQTMIDSKKVNETSKKERPMNVGGEAKDDDKRGN